MRSIARKVPAPTRAHAAMQLTIAPRSVYHPNLGGRLAVKVTWRCRAAILVVQTGAGLGRSLSHMSSATARLEGESGRLCWPEKRRLALRCEAQRRSGEERQCHTCNTCHTPAFDDGARSTINLGCVPVQTPLLLYVVCVTWGRAGVSRKDFPVGSQPPRRPSRHHQLSPRAAGDAL